MNDLGGDIDRIFDAFIATKPNGMGMGMGPAVSRSIVEAREGCLQACAVAPSFTWS